MVPLVTPARRATSSSLVAAKPRSANTSSAAVTISSGRASLRRRHRGCARVRALERLVRVRISGKSYLLNGQLVKRVPMPLRYELRRLPVVENEVGARRLMAQLAQERHDLAAMVGRVVDKVPKHLAEGVNVFSTAGRLYELRLLQPSGWEGRQESPPLCLDRLPAIPHRPQVLKIRSLWHGG